jgi:transposase
MRRWPAGGEPLLEHADPKAVIADMAYDADALRFCSMFKRNLVERSCNKLKHFRVIAARYDKLARNFLAGAHLAFAIILLS